MDLLQQEKIVAVRNAGYKSPYTQTKEFD